MTGVRNVALEIVAARDTREPMDPKLYWDLGDLKTVRCTRKTADYSIIGLEDVVGLERKTLGDLVSTLTAGRERFERELDRLATFKRAAIIVEADLDDVINARYRSRVSPSCLVGSFGSFFGRWGIPTVFAGNKRNAEILARAFLVKSAKALLPAASEDA